MATIPSETAKHLESQGWASLALADSADVRGETISVAQQLGQVVPRLTNKPIESILPHSESTARPSSLSHVFGLGALPLHSDTAHWAIPCRYIVLTCTEIGAVNTPTTLADTNDPSFSAEERQLLRSSTFIIKSGRRSFYGSMIDAQRRFTRFDPGCMFPVTDASRIAMNLYSMERQRNRLVTHHWRQGEVLIINNWRTLHGRGNEMPADPLRQLLRVYVR
jgi:Taurine catabolism dioxygenase TauD, TfdA family